MEGDDTEKIPNVDSLEAKLSNLSDNSDPVKGSHLPVARVKKIMKETEHQGMISSDAPVILAKACEMLIRDLTLQSWNCTQMTKRCTLQRQDIKSAIFNSNIYNFLYDILTPEDLKPIMETQTELPTTYLSSRHNQKIPNNSRPSFNSTAGLKPCGFKGPYPKEGYSHLRNKIAHPYPDFRQGYSLIQNNKLNEGYPNVNSNNYFDQNFNFDFHDLSYSSFPQYRSSPNFISGQKLYPNSFKEPKMNTQSHL
uniref:HAP-family transcription factor, putative n=1 Tax=Theileria annulata TaxID=5874 RepID=A0A3B0MGA1_THEAN